MQIYFKNLNKISKLQLLPISLQFFCFRYKISHSWFQEEKLMRNHNSAPPPFMVFFLNCRTVLVLVIRPVLEKVPGQLLRVCGHPGEAVPVQHHLRPVPHGQCHLPAHPAL